MQQIKADLDEEIKSRIAVENANQKNQLQHRSCQQLHQDAIQLNNKRTNLMNSNSDSKLRSKSVTFLDAISADNLNKNTESVSNRASYHEKKDDFIYHPPISQTNSNSNKKSLKTGDVRLMCGALTGAGPIRSIIKKSATDLSIILNAQLSDFPRVDHDNQRSSNTEESSDDCARNQKRQSDL
jgi:hypothetical protein